ncbi:MAG: hypothetical protein PGN07_03820 [Aeromicrobium erythreum]
MNRPEIDASPAALRRAAPLWESLADDLGTAGRRLTGAHDASATLGPRVQPALDRFLEQWGTSARRRSRQARGHGEQLREMSRTYTALDLSTADELRSLLPWPSTPSPGTPLTLLGTSTPQDPFGRTP